ncbi:MAG: EamA family transporter [Burkholderiales bacterium]|nr:EamA family transporter [Burkholderiales bacterium]
MLLRNIITQWGFTPNDLTSQRMIGAGVILLAFIAFTQRRNPFRDLLNSRNFRDLAVYGSSILAMQYSFFVAIDVSNAGTATIMVGFGPLFIIAYSFLFKGRRPIFREFLCVFLAFVGIAFIITKGNFTGLDLSWKGSFWGIVSAAFGAVNPVQPRSVMDRIGVTSVVGWGMLIEGLLSCLFINPFASGITWNLTTFLCSLFLIVFGTVVPFCCYLKSTDYIIPSASAILNSFEPLSAVVLSVLILGTSFNVWEVLGGLAIISNMVILSWPTGKSITATGR